MLSKQRTQLVTDSPRDFTGFDVQARDGKIGRIDPATHATGPHHIVVKTGFSIFGTKRIVSGHDVKSIDYGLNNVNVSISKDQIKNRPRYQPTRA